jgi:hypothetical protein
LDRAAPQAADHRASNRITLKNRSNLLPAFTLLLAGPLLADGSELLGAPSIPVIPNGRAVLAGTGLVDSQPGLISVALPTDAVVAQVLAYWDGLDAPADSQGDFDDIILGGQAVTGTRIGGPTNFFKNYWVSSYRADVTALGLVGGGASQITIEGLDFSYANNGLALVIITQDERTFEVRDGLDYAQEKFNSPFDQSAPVIYTFDPADGDRGASVGLVVGGVAYGRPSVIEIKVDGVLTVEAIDTLQSNVGSDFDVLNLDLLVPAGASEVQVRILSEDRGGPFSGNQAASFTWLHASLSLDSPADVPQYGCEPQLWAQGWWRWDPRDFTDNATTSVVLTDPFNQVFGVTPYQSGLRDNRMLWHGLQGWSNWWNIPRRELNREAVAALANADSDFNYPLTVEEVKALYLDALNADQDTADADNVFWTFYDANRLGCPW